LHQRLLRDAVHAVIYPRSVRQARPFVRLAGRLGTSAVVATTRFLEPSIFQRLASETMRDANYAKPTSSSAT